MTKNIFPVLSLLLWLSPACAGSGASGQALEHSRQAASHASVAAASAIAGSGQAASAAVAVPLAITGALVEAVGKASSSGAEKLAGSATGAGLEISDDSITAGTPPNEAMQNQNERLINNGQNDNVHKY